MTPKIDDYYSTPAKQGVNGTHYRPDGSSVNRSEALALHQLVKQSGATGVLEVGLGLGGSAVAIAEALEQKGGPGRLVTLDPFQDTFGNVGLNELERLSLRHRVEFLPVYAEDFLHESAKSERRFDFIFIDGAHSIGSKMTNTFFANRCLARGGILAFHDAFMASTAACAEYLLREQDFELVPLPPDSGFKRLARRVRYCAKLGWWYSSRVIPHTHGSLVALRLPAGSSRNR